MLMNRLPPCGTPGGKHSLLPLSNGASSHHHGEDRMVALTRALTHHSWRPSTSPEAIRVHTRRRLHIRLQPGLHDPGGEWTGGQEGNVPRSSSLSYRCRGPSQWPGPGETARTVIRHDGTDGLQSRESWEAPSCKEQFRDVTCNLPNSVQRILLKFSFLIHGENKLDIDISEWSCLSSRHLTCLPK